MKKKLAGWGTVLSLAASGLVVAAPATKEVISFGSNPGGLRMFKYIPARLHAAPPLVVALHGCSQDARDYDDESGWVQLAEKWGFALLLPQQEGYNNPMKCFNWFNGSALFDFWWPGTDQDRDRGEALSIRQMVDKMKAEHAVNPQQIYVTGLSAGAGMTAVMLATYPEIFAGGAIIAGIPYKCTSNSAEALTGCGVDAEMQGKVPIKNLEPAQWGKYVKEASKHTGPWPRVSIWQGSADKVVSPANARELVEQWTYVHGIQQPPVEDTVKGYPREQYKDATGKVQVERYTITGLGHGTPIDPGQGEEGCGVSSTFILDANICSSFHIGKFWGLDKPVPAAP